MRTSSWEKDKDIIAGTESFDDDFGSAYDRVAYDVPNKGNAAGIKLPKRASEMTIGELEDFYGTANRPTEARIKSQTYGAKRFGSDSPQAKYGSSGTGKYQFEVTTLSQTAKELYGDNYRNVVYSPDEQEKLAKHLYTKKAAEGPEALGKTWFAMKNKTAAGPSADAYDSPSSALTNTVAAAAPAVAVAAPVAAIAALGTKDKQDDSMYVGREDEPVGTFRNIQTWFSPESRLKKMKSMLDKQVILRRKTERSKTPVRFKALRKAIQEQIIKDSEDSENL